MSGVKGLLLLSSLPPLFTRVFILSSGHKKRTKSRLLGSLQRVEKRERLSLFSQRQQKMPIWVEWCEFSIQSFEEEEPADRARAPEEGDVDGIWGERRRQRRGKGGYTTTAATATNNNSYSHNNSTHNPEATTTRCNQSNWAGTCEEAWGYVHCTTALASRGMLLLLLFRLLLLLSASLSRYFLNLDAPFFCGFIISPPSL